MSNEGLNRLARVLDWRMKLLDRKPAILDFGEIQGDMSLLTNKFPVPIPRADYIICRSVDIAPGDRVLVAWAGDDAVVIDAII